MLLLSQAVILFAQAAEESTGRNYAISWALILLSVILGLLVVLRNPKREDKVKKVSAD